MITEAALIKDGRKMFGCWKHGFCQIVDLSRHVSPIFFNNLQPELWHLEVANEKAVKPTEFWKKFHLFKGIV